jgi:NAD(P)-dependent dehydrogenase (short-subunit alcohol dehydrogenase family)
VAASNSHSEYNIRPLDITDEPGVKKFFAEIGAVDHIAVTAGDWGGAGFSSTADIDLDQARKSLDVRFWGSLVIAKYASQVISPEGSIVLTGGMLSHRPSKGMPLVTAVAGALEHLARGLAVDLAPLRINAVSPGLVLTDQVRQMPAEVIDTFTSHLPISRAATPAEAALAYIYLMQNPYITGQVLPVDGGAWLV